MPYFPLSNRFTEVPKVGHDAFNDYIRSQPKNVFFHKCPWDDTKMIQVTEIVEAESIPRASWSLIRYGHHRWDYPTEAMRILPDWGISYVNDLANCGAGNIGAFCMDRMPEVDRIPFFKYVFDWVKGDMNKAMVGATINYHTSGTCLKPEAEEELLRNNFKIVGRTVNRNSGNVIKSFLNLNGTRSEYL